MSTETSKTGNEAKSAGEIKIIVRPGPLAVCEAIRTDLVSDLRAEKVGTIRNDRTEPPAYKHIVFDFGGVFLDLEGKPTNVPKQLAKVFNAPEDKVEKIWMENRSNLLKGKETPKQFLSFLNKALGLNTDVDSAYTEWSECYKLERERINWELVEYMKTLKKNYHIHMLTDTIDLPKDKDPLFSELARHFDNVLMSHEEGLRKPDRDAFLNLLRRINARPEECIFIDDVEANVATANELGMKAILFINVDKLREDLRCLRQAASVAGKRINKSAFKR